MGPYKPGCRVPPGERRRPSGGDGSTAPPLSATKSASIPDWAQPPTSKDLGDLESRIRASSAALASIKGGGRVGDQRRKLLTAVQVKRHQRWHDITAALRTAEVAATTATATATAGGLTPDRHACPACLSERDDHGDAAGMCHACGQRFCGECNIAMTGCADGCPCCGGDLVVSPEAAFERLLRLVASPPGRHTAAAQCALAALYERGCGVPQDQHEAARLYQLAADQGSAEAQCKDPHANHPEPA